MHKRFVIPCLVLPILAATAHGQATGSEATANRSEARSEASMPRLAKPAVVRTVQTATGALRGRVLAHGTRTPVQPKSLKLRNEADKTVVDLAAAKNGTFKTPVLQTGSYTLILDGGVTIALAVHEEGTIESLDIVLPKDNAEANDEAETGPAQGPARRGPPPAPSGGISPLGWGLIGVGAAAAIAVPIVIANNDDDDERPVSLSNARILR